LPVILDFHLQDHVRNRIRARSIAASSPATSISRRTAMSATESAPDQSASSPTVSESAILLCQTTTTSVAESKPDQSAASPPASTTAQVPAADLNPLYNFVQDCRACQLQLAAAKQNAADDTLKSPPQLANATPR
jgi:hypothetical protein